MAVNPARISRGSIERRSGLKAPSEPSCRVPTYIVYFFKFILGGDFSLIFFYLKSSHRLKSISGTIIIIVDNNNFDFIAFLLLEPQPSESRFS